MSYPYGRPTMNRFMHDHDEFRDAFDTPQPWDTYPLPQSAQQTSDTDTQPWNPRYSLAEHTYKPLTLSPVMSRDFFRTQTEIGTSGQTPHLNSNTAVSSGRMYAPNNPYALPSVNTLEHNWPMLTYPQDVTTDYYDSVLDQAGLGTGFAHQTQRPRVNDREVQSIHDIKFEPSAAEAPICDDFDVRERSSRHADVDPYTCTADVIDRPSTLSHIDTGNVGDFWARFDLDENHTDNILNHNNRDLGLTTSAPRSIYPRMSEVKIEDDVLSSRFQGIGAANDSLPEFQQTRVPGIDPFLYHTEAVPDRAPNPYQAAPSQQTQVPNNGLMLGLDPTDSYPGGLSEKDIRLLRLKNEGLSYRQIKLRGAFKDAESTLRGRYRTLTKRKEDRVRKPKWTASDVETLRQSVAHFLSQSPRRVFNAGTDGQTVDACRDKKALDQISWKQVAEHMARRGCYKYGNATVKKKYFEVMDIR